METMEINGGQNVRQHRDGDIEFREQLHFSAGGSRINFQLFCNRDEVFLKYLQRNHARSCASVLCD
jgi:hypothetical protein